jgi:hypothetical protein
MPSRSGTVQVRNTIATARSSHSNWRRMRSSPVCNARSATVPQRRTRGHEAPQQPAPTRQASRTEATPGTPTPSSAARLSEGKRRVAANKIAKSVTNGSVKRQRRDRNRPVGRSSKIIGMQNAIAQGQDTFAQVAISRQKTRWSEGCDPTPAKKRPPLTRHSTPRRPAVASHRIARPLPPNRPAGNGQRAADH